jgi:hypothetical protein
VPLGADLVIVFETDESVRMALEESLRSERVTDGDRIDSERSAFARLLGDEAGLAATLYVDAADPVVLADRLTELTGVEDAVSLDVGGTRVAARSDRGDSGSGAFHLLFDLSGDQRAAWVTGAPASVRVDHPACRAVATLSAEQTQAIGVDLRR